MTQQVDALDTSFKSNMTKQLAEHSSTLENIPKLIEESVVNNFHGMDAAFKSSMNAQLAEHASTLDNISELIEGEVIKKNLTLDSAFKNSTSIQLAEHAATLGNIPNLIHESVIRAKCWCIRSPRVRTLPVLPNSSSKSPSMSVVKSLSFKWVQMISTLTVTRRLWASLRGCYT